MLRELESGSTNHESQAGHASARHRYTMRQLGCDKSLTRRMNDVIYAVTRPPAYPSEPPRHRTKKLLWTLISMFKVGPDMEYEKSRKLFDESDFRYVSRAELNRRTRLGKNQLTNALKELADAGIITRHYEFGEDNLKRHLHLRLEPARIFQLARRSTEKEKTPLVALEVPEHQLTDEECDKAEKAKVRKERSEKKRPGALFSASSDAQHRAVIYSSGPTSRPPAFQANGSGSASEEKKEVQGGSPALSLDSGDPQGGQDKQVKLTVSPETKELVELVRQSIPDTTGYDDQAVRKLIERIETRNNNALTKERFEMYRSTVFCSSVPLADNKHEWIVNVDFAQFARFWPRIWKVVKAAQALTSAIEAQPLLDAVADPARWLEQHCARVLGGLELHRLHHEGMPLLNLMHGLDRTAIDAGACAMLSETSFNHDAYRLCRYVTAHQTGREFRNLKDPGDALYFIRWLEEAPVRFLMLISLRMPVHEWMSWSGLPVPLLQKMKTRMTRAARKLIARAGALALQDHDMFAQLQGRVPLAPWEFDADMLAVTPEGVRTAGKLGWKVGSE